MKEYFNQDDFVLCEPGEEVSWLNANELLCREVLRAGVPKTAENIVKQENKYREMLPTMLNEFVHVLFETGCSVNVACQKSGMRYGDALHLRGMVPKLDALWKEAFELASDKLESAAFTRAVDGVWEPVFQGGVLVGEKQKFSDSLLSMMLQGRKPDIYASKSKSEVINKTGVEEMTDEELDRMIEEKMKRLGMKND